MGVRSKGGLLGSECSTVKCPCKKIQIKSNERSTTAKQPQQPRIVTPEKDESEVLAVAIQYMDFTQNLQY